MQEYLLVERKAAFKSEFLAGSILAMAGGTLNHHHIAANVISELHSGLRKTRCIVLTGGMRVSVAQGEAVFYPDVSVTCGEPESIDRHSDVLLNPVLVVEISSRSTSRYDRLVKVPLYKQTPSITDILLVSQERPRVEHQFRAEDGEWKAELFADLEQTIALPALRCKLPLKEVYSRVPFA